MQLKDVAIDLLRIDGGTQIRAALNLDAISDYTHRTVAGEVAPPVDVYFDGSQYWLANGFHRYHAAKVLEQIDIRANVHVGTKDDAILFACGANADNGVPRTATDKRNAVESALRVYAGRGVRGSDEVIAKVCRVSDRFVRSLRQELTTSDLGTVPKLTLPTKTKGKDGRTRETKNNGKKKPKPESIPPEEESEEHTQEAPRRMNEKHETVRKLAGQGYTVTDIAEKTKFTKGFIHHAMRQAATAKSPLHGVAQDAEVFHEYWQSTARSEGFQSKWKIMSLKDRQSLISILEQVAKTMTETIRRLNKEAKGTTK